MRLTDRRRTQRGLTLIELVIVMAIVGILAAFVVPSYTESVARARRADARGALGLAAQWLERFRAENGGSYAGAVLPAAMAASPTDSTPQYTIALDNLTPVGYRLSAVPRPGGAMANDPCGTLTLAQDGRRTAAGQSSGELVARCWAR